MKKTIQELVIGSAIFLFIDRGARLVSKTIVEQGETKAQQASLYVELFILVCVILIVWKVLKL